MNPNAAHVDIKWFSIFFYLLLILISLKESPKTHTLLDFFLINIYSQEQ